MYRSADERSISARSFKLRPQSPLEDFSHTRVGECVYGLPALFPCPKKLYLIDLGTSSSLESAVLQRLKPTTFRGGQRRQLLQVYFCFRFFCPPFRQPSGY